MNIVKKTHNINTNFMPHLKNRVSCFNCSSSSDKPYINQKKKIQLRIIKISDYVPFH